MRDKVSVVYYPDMDASNSTTKKAILFFDEIHFVDRPSLSFGKQGTWGSFTTVGCPSSFRELQPVLKEEGIAAYVHPAPVMGPVSQELYAQISADINDRAFLDAFQTGLKASPAFGNLQVKPATMVAGEVPKKC